MTESEEKTFPIMDRNRYGLVDGRGAVTRCDLAKPVTSVPWSLVEPLRENCFRVHGQTLERLAERGGLSLAELWMHVHGLQWVDTLHRPDDLRAWARNLGGKPTKG